MATELPGPRMILVAERDRNVRELQRFFLERAGFGVRFVDDGLSALEHAASASPAPSAIVTEILLPRLDGLTLCRRLREAPATRDVPVIVCSILAASARAHDAGATAFLRKPIVESLFVATVRDAISPTSPAPMERP